MNLLTIGMIGAGLYLVMQPKKQSSGSPYIGSSLDKGFKVIVPCKEFDIYDPEASKKWMYDEMSRFIDFYRKNKNILTEKDLTDIGDTVSAKFYGCKKGEDMHLEANPKYYKWAFGNAKAAIQAFIDKNLITNEQGQILINVILSAIQSAGLDIFELDNQTQSPLLKGALFNCESLKITNIELFKTSVKSIIDEIIQELKINKDSLFFLDIVNVMNKFMKKLNNKCLIDPSKMSKNAKILYALFATGVLDDIRKVIALNIIDPNFDYESYTGDLIGYDCPDFGDNEEPVLGECKYYFGPQELLYQEWEKTESQYREQIGKYLKLTISDDDLIDEAATKLKTNLQYP